MGTGPGRGLSIVFGLILFLRSGAGLLALLWLVGIYAILFGILFIVRAFQLRSWASSVIRPAS